MVLLTMTSAIVAAVKEYEASRQHSDEAPSTEPDLSTPEVGKPISHGQIIDISKHLKSIAARTPDAQHTPYHLNDLLQGSQIYVAPPRPKAEPVCCSNLTNLKRYYINHNPIHRPPNTNNSWLDCVAKRKLDPTNE